MSAVDRAPPAPAATGGRAGERAGAATTPATPARRWPWWLSVALVLAAAAGLRVWGVGHGLPYAYNADENAHFVPGAIGLFGHSYNPHYFVNPPAYTYLLHAVFAVWFGGREGVSRAFASDPTEVFTVARLTAAALGTLAVWLLYVAGARLVDRRCGLLAAALLAVGFLPVFYSHLALNDVPSLAPIALALVGVAGVLHRARTRDYLLAGLGLGLACATKYTGGIVLVALLGAAGAQLATSGAAGAATRVVRGLVLAALVAIAAFLVANPYAVLDFAAFADGLAHQATATDDELGKLGLTQPSGHLYYLWALTWGLGWAPALVAVASAFMLVAGDRRLAAVLVPAPLLFLLFMGTQERFFGRWLLPMFPIVCLMAAYGAVRLVDVIGRRAGALRPALMSAAVVVLLGQGIVHSLHSGLVLSQDDTRNVTRAWMVANVAVGTKIVVEPVVPDAWATDVGRPLRETANGARWTKFPTSRSRIARDGSLLTGPGRVVNIEDYERTLVPGLIDRYEREGYCLVVSGSTQRGRAQAEPRAVPRAIDYYRELERRGTIVHRSSPYREGAEPVAFSFDWSFNFYPLAYARPGPDMTVYRLRGGACAGDRAPDS